METISLVKRILREDKKKLFLYFLTINFEHADINSIYSLAFLYFIVFAKLNFVPQENKQLLPKKQWVHIAYMNNFQNYVAFFVHSKYDIV